MKYTDFEWTLVNRIFTSAVFFCDEYSGFRHIVIQDWNHEMIMICVNRDEDEIRVSFPKEQKYFKDYKETLDYIKTDEWR